MGRNQGRLLNLNHLENVCKRTSSKSLSECLRRDASGIAIAYVMTSNPVPIHGNYYGYYNKRPSITDSRLALLPPEILSGKIVLDIGCNEGWVTCEIGKYVSYLTRLLTLIMG